jgi:hypothetical protein
MITWAKVFLVVGAASVIAFAQASDTASKQTSSSSSSIKQSAATVTTPAPDIKYPTGVKQKTPTNWSKIKDLFL